MEKKLKTEGVAAVAKIGHKQKKRSNDIREFLGQLAARNNLKTVEGAFVQWKCGTFRKPQAEQQDIIAEFN